MTFCKIALTRGKCALVDEVDAELVRTFKWQAVRRLNSWYPQAVIDRRVVLMHQMLNPLPQPLRNDHKNGNGLDNRRKNLRPATQQQNQWNRRRCRKNASGFKGVAIGPDGKWQARIKINGFSKSLGLFVNPVDAAIAYDAKARELHGEFACVNFPLPGERSAA